MQNNQPISTEAKASIAAKLLGIPLAEVLAAQKCANAALAQQNAGIELAIATMEQAQETAIAIQESIANGDFPDFEDLKSTRLGATISAQFDESNGTLLIATNETQILLSAHEVQALAVLLHDERDALYEVLHNEMHSKYQ